MFLVKIGFFSLLNTYLVFDYLVHIWSNMCLPLNKKKSRHVALCPVGGSKLLLSLQSEQSEEGSSKLIVASPLVSS